MTKPVAKGKGSRPRPRSSSRAKPDPKAAASRKRMKARILANTARLSVIETRLGIVDDAVADDARDGDT